MLKLAPLIIYSFIKSGYLLVEGKRRKKLKERQKLFGDTKILKMYIPTKV